MSISVEVMKMFALALWPVFVVVYLASAGG